MDGAMSRWSLGLVVAAALLVLPACQNQRLLSERDALYVPTRALQDELNRTRDALDAAEADRLAMIEQLEELRANQAARAVELPPADSGFSRIEGVETIQGAGTVTVRVPGDVLFEPGRVELKSSAKATLSEIADVIQEEYAGNTIRVEGYTDTDPIRKSSWDDNLELSLQRAAAVHRYLQEQGVDADRMYAAGFGQTKPRATKAQSRRVEIVVVLRQ